eukprot:SAG31_NODE_4633_length_3083_cov_5.088807_5_plen_121_part_00
MPVLALGNVACAVAARGQGWGGAIVRHALVKQLQERKRLPALTHALFETAIPAFYGVPCKVSFEIASIFFLSHARLCYIFWMRLCLSWHMLCQKNLGRFSCRKSLSSTPQEMKLLSRTSL